MKMLRVLGVMLLVMAGVLLLTGRGRAQAGAVQMKFVPTRFTVVDEGTAGKPDVVLIPGVASSRAVWDVEAKKLAPNYRLHLVQVNGFAGQPAGANADGAILPGLVEELHGYIAASGMHPVVMGHSMGGLLTLMLAEKYPGDVSKLVIVDALPFYGLVLDPDATVESIAPQAMVFGDQMLAAPPEQFAAMQAMMAKQLVKDDAGAKAVAASAAASDRKVMVRAMLEDLQTDLRPDMAKIRTPALMLYPFDSAMHNADESRFDGVYKTSYAAMPNVKVVRVDGSRHFIMYDQPEKLDDAVEAFLK